MRHPRRTALFGAVLLALVAVAALIARDKDGVIGDVPVVPTPPQARNDREAVAAARPFAYADDRAGDLERRAAAGSSHTLYARSPDLLEGLVFLESAGREDAMTAAAPESPSA